MKKFFLNILYKLGWSHCVNCAKLIPEEKTFCSEVCRDAWKHGVELEFLRQTLESYPEVAKLMFGRQKFIITGLVPSSPYRFKILPPFNFKAIGGSGGQAGGDTSGGVGYGTNGAGYGGRRDEEDNG